MKAYGDIEVVNLRIGERQQRVVGNGESRLFRIGDRVIDSDGRSGEVINVGRSDGDQYLSVRFDEPIWSDGCRVGGVHAEGLCHKQEEIQMHYRNGREAKNGDKIVQLTEYGDVARITAVGVLYDAKPTGSEYCNGSIAPIQSSNVNACLIDCLHVDDLAAILKEKGLDKRPKGK